MYLKFCGMGWIKMFSFRPILFDVPITFIDNNKLNLNAVYRQHCAQFNTGLIY